MTANILNSEKAKNMSAEEIFSQLSTSKKGLTSEELSKVVEPTIESVIYHLKKPAR